MTGPAHIIKTTYEPPRNLILPVARFGASELKPAALTHQEPTATASQQIRRFHKMPEGTGRNFDKLDNFNKQSTSRPRLFLSPPAAFQWTVRVRWRCA